MYIGCASPSHLRSFLDGYWLGTGYIEQDDTPDFNDFFDWVAKKLGYGESTSGWQNMIEDQRPDQEEALWLFFELLDEFRGIEHETVAEVEYHQRVIVDTSWRGYCRFKRVRGKLKVLPKPLPEKLIVKHIKLAERWYSLIALTSKNEVLEVRSADNLAAIFKRAHEIFGVEQEEWKVIDANSL